MERYTRCPYCNCKILARRLPGHITVAHDLKEGDKKDKKTVIVAGRGYKPQSDERSGYKGR